MINAHHVCYTNFIPVLERLKDKVIKLYFRIILHRYIRIKKCASG